MRKTPLYILGLLVVALAAAGLVVLCSASGTNAARLHHGNVYFFVERQFIYLAAGLATAVVVALFDYHKWRENWLLTVLFYLGIAVLLGLVFLYPPVNGSRRWINLGHFKLQPSELGKLATVIVLAVHLDRLGWRVQLFKQGAFYTALILVPIVGTVLFEPDFGSVMVILGAGALLMFLAGVRFWHMICLGLMSIPLVLYKILSNANRMGRIAAFLGGDDTNNPAAYQVAMARVALQRGGISGVGYMQSMQKHGYLPEAHTDFIFAVGAEEWGLVFTVAILLLFVLFFIVSLVIAHRASDRLGRFLVYGMAFIIFFQACFNIAVVSEAVPTKGMALPFFSYGGTNLVSAFFAVGVIFSVGIHSVNNAKRHIKLSSRS